MQAASSPNRWTCGFRILVFTGLLFFDSTETQGSWWDTLYTQPTKHIPIQQTIVYITGKYFYTCFCDNEKSLLTGPERKKALTDVKNRWKMWWKRVTWKSRKQVATILLQIKKVASVKFRQQMCDMICFRFSENKSCSIWVEFLKINTLVLQMANQQEQTSTSWGCSKWAMTKNNVLWELMWQNNFLI